jgi:monoamine oxidase
LYEDAISHGAEFRLNTVVEEVRWTQNNVELVGRDASGEKLYKSKSVIITLPLGVWLAGADAVGAVRFVPEVIEKRVAANKLAPGAAVRILMRFRKRFWEALSIPTQEGNAIRMDDLAFIHAPEELVPTWWTLLPQRVPILVGWAGGSRAELLQVEGQDLILQHALKALTKIVGMQREQVEDLLEEFYFHDWQRDPFSREAYSYIPVGGLDAQAQLGQAIGNTLFFAGEATNTEGHHGTVHGAIATGLRAAREIIASNT